MLTETIHTVMQITGTHAKLIKSNFNIKFKKL